MGNPINGGPKFLYHVKHSAKPDTNDSTNPTNPTNPTNVLTLLLTTRYKNLGLPFIGLPNCVTSEGLLRLLVKRRLHIFSDTCRLLICQSALASIFFKVGENASAHLITMRTLAHDLEGNSVSLWTALQMHDKDSSNAEHWQWWHYTNIDWCRGSHWKIMPRSCVMLPEGNITQLRALFFSVDRG